jgi:hypothetical protein
MSRLVPVTPGPTRTARLLLLAAVLSVLPSGARGFCLTVTGGNQESVLAAVPVEAGTPFSLTFVNSIYGEPVKETYVYEPSEGILSIRVESPSAGVFEYYGLEPDGTGVAALRRRVGPIRVRSHDYTGHILAVGGKEISLKGLVPGGEPLTIKVGEDGACFFGPSLRP